MTTAAKKTPKKKTPKKQAKTPIEEKVVFAFRLSRDERALIHKAAGPAKASRFVRTLVIAASKGDADTVRKIAEAVDA